MVSRCRSDIHCVFQKASWIPRTIPRGGVFHISKWVESQSQFPAISSPAGTQQQRGSCRPMRQKHRFQCEAMVRNSSGHWIRITTSQNTEMLVCENFPLSLVCFKSLLAGRSAYTYSDTSRIPLELFVNPQSAMHFYLTMNYCLFENICWSILFIIYHRKQNW